MSDELVNSLARELHDQTRVLEIDKGKELFAYADASAAHDFPFDDSFVATAQLSDNVPEQLGTRRRLHVSHVKPFV